MDMPQGRSVCPAGGTMAFCDIGAPEPLHGSGTKLKVDFGETRRHNPSRRESYPASVGFLTVAVLLSNGEIDCQLRKFKALPRWFERR
jgi:hypothetical protein